MKNIPFNTKKSSNKSQEKLVIVTSLLVFASVISLLISIIGGKFPTWITVILTIIVLFLVIIIFNIIGGIKHIKEKLILFKKKRIFDKNKNNFIKQLGLRIDDFSRLIDIPSCPYALPRIFESNPEVEFHFQEFEIIKIIFYQYKKKYSELNRDVFLNLFVKWLDEFNAFIRAFEKYIDFLNREKKIFKNQDNNYKEFKTKCNKFLDYYEKFLENVEMKLDIDVKYSFNRLW